MRSIGLEKDFLIAAWIPMVVAAMEMKHLVGFLALPIDVDGMKWGLKAAFTPVASMADLRVAFTIGQQMVAQMRPFQRLLDFLRRRPSQPDGGSKMIVSGRKHLVRKDCMLAAVMVNQYTMVSNLASFSKLVRKARHLPPATAHPTHSTSKVLP